VLAAGFVVMQSAESQSRQVQLRCRGVLGAGVGAGPRFRVHQGTQNSITELRTTTIELFMEIQELHQLRPQKLQVDGLHQDVIHARFKATLASLRVAVGSEGRDHGPSPPPPVLADDLACNGEPIHLQQQQQKTTRKETNTLKMD